MFKFCFSKISAAEIDPSEISFVKSRRLVEVGAAEDYPTEARPTKVGITEVPFKEIRLPRDPRHGGLLHEAPDLRQYFPYATIPRLDSLPQNLEMFFIGHAA